MLCNSKVDFFHDLAEIRCIKCVLLLSALCVSPVHSQGPVAFFESSNYRCLSHCAGGVLDYLLKETEHLHGKIRRFTSPDEHPFFPDDVPPITLRPITYASVPFCKSTFCFFVSFCKSTFCFLAHQIASLLIQI